MKKRNLIALLMAVCMMFSLLPVNAIAVGDEGNIPAEETHFSENGNDPAPAGSTNPAGDKDSIPDTGDKPAAAEEPVKGEESGKDEEPAKDEEGGETNVVPMRVVRPDTDKYLTYVFRVDGAEVSRQIVKKGDTLYQPVSPVKDGYKFTGWFVGASELAFGIVGEISESAQINVDAGFTEVLYVFFADTNGRIVHTKEGVKGDVIKTDDVTYGLENTTDAITGWYLEQSYQTRVESVTLDKENITVYAKVEPGHWLYFDSDGGTYVAPKFYSANEVTAAPNAEMTKPGYTFGYWEYKGAKFTFGSLLTENVTLTAHWNANTNTQYTVIYWQENADDDDYSYVENETLRGTTGAQTSASAKSYTGFTAQTVTQKIIEGDGSTIVNVYYKRNVYSVKFFSYSGWYSSSTEYTALRITAKYGANISDKWPTYDGSNTWSTSDGGSTYQVNIDTMPLNGASFYGPKTGSGSETAYYYVEVLPGESGTTVSGKTYKLHHSDTSPGSGYTVSVEDQYPITGFTFNKSISTKIKADYNNAKFYYTRNSYDVVYISGGKTVNTVSYKYEQGLTGAGSYTPAAKPTGMEVYTFGGWYEDPTLTKEYKFDSKTMPANNITVYAKWAKPEYTGTIYVDVAGTVTGLKLTIPYGGTIDRNELDKLTLTYPDNDSDNWVFAGWTTDPDNRTPFNFGTQIYGDTTLYPYFSNKSECTVTYYNGEESKTDARKYAVNAVADAMSIEALGFAAPKDKVFLGWAESDGGPVKYQPNDDIKITGNITLYAVWGNKDAVVSLTYKANGGSGADHVEKEIVNNGLVTLWDGSGFSRTGYTLDGWSTDPNAASAEYKTGSTARVDSTGDNILYAVWKANENTAYKVEFYCEQTDGTYTLAKTDPRTGTTDATVSVTDGDKGYGAPTYVYDEGNTNNRESGAVAADGSLTLKLYFKRNTAEYTIHHYLKGTEVKVAPDQTGTMTIGDTLTASASTALGAEYASAHVNSYSPSQSLEMKAAGNVITVYYTVPLTITAESASRAYNAQPLTQPDFKVEGLVNGDQKTDITLSMTKESTITNVGSVPNVIDTTTVQFKGGELPGGYYELPTYKPGTLTITADETEVVVTITGNTATKVYNAAEQSVTGYTTDVGTKTITVALKDGHKAEAKGTNVGKYYMGLSAADFTVTSSNYSNIKVVVNDGWLEITPITDEVTVTITGNHDSKVYNAAEQSVTGFTTDVGDKTIDVALNAGFTAEAKGTNVGKYFMGLSADAFSVSSDNYANIKVVVNDGWLEITPITDEVTVTITGSTDTKVYNASEQSVTGYTTNVGNKTINVALKTGHTAEAKGTDVGKYFMGLSADDFTVTSSNYKNIKVIVNDGWLEITPITDEVTVTITGNHDTKVYNGSEQSVTGFTTDVGEKTITVALKDGVKAEAKGTNVNTYYMGLTEESFSVTSKNYSKITVEVIDGYLTITPITAPIIITANSAGKTYDGTALTDPGYTYTENVLLEGDTLTAVVVGSATNVGDEGKNVVKSYKVTRGGADVTGNYTFGVSVDGTLTINPRQIELTANSASKQYDGTPLTDSGYTISNGSFVGEEGLAGVTVEGSQTAVGSSANTITGHKLKSNTLEKNYTITYKLGTLTVTQSEKVITVTANSHTWEYDGQPHSDGGYTVSYDGQTYTAAAGKTVTLPTGDVVSAAVEGTVTNVTDSKADNNKVTLVTIKNGKGEDVNGQFKTITLVAGTLTITRRGEGEKKVVLTALDNVVTYDGQPHGAALNAAGAIEAGTSYTITYLAKGHKVQTVNIAGSRTYVGMYPNELVPSDAIIVDAQDNDVTANYLIGYEKGDLQIVAPGTVVVKIRGVRGSAVYDGKLHEVNGYTVESISNTTYKASDFGLTADKHAHAEGTNVGDYYMGLESESFVNNNTQNFPSVEFVIVEDGLLTITPVTGEVIVTIKGNTDTVEYDGKLHEVNGYTVESISNSLYTEKDFGLAEGKHAHAEGTNADKYFMELTPASFVNNSGNFEKVTFVVEDGWLNITRRGEGKQKVVLTAADNTVVYDGQPHGAKRNAAGAIEAGTSYTITNLAEGHSVQTVAIDGTETAVGEYPNKLVPSGAKIVDAADNDVTANYVVTYVNGKLAITAGDITKYVTLTTADVTEKYDGKTYTSGTATAKDANGGGIKIEYCADGKTWVEDPALITATDVADSKEIQVRASGTNYEGYVTGKQDLTITKRTVILTSVTDEKPYDGTPLTRPDVAVTGDGFVDGEVSDIKATGSVTYVREGAVDNTITYTENKTFKAGNYEITKETGTLKITPISDKIIITANSAGKTYDGKALTDSGFTFTGTLQDGDKLTAVVEGSATNVGDEGKNVVTGHKILRGSVDVTGNYTFGDSVDGKLTINPVEIELTANSASKVYDGKALTDGGYKITKGKFVGSEGLASVTVVGSQTVAGSSDNTITGHELKEGTLAKNYTITYKPGTLTVTRAAEAVVTINGHTDTQVYNGKRQTVTGYDVVKPDTTITVTLNETGKDTAGGINAGTYYMGLKPEDFTAKSDNYSKITIIVNDGYLKITPITDRVTVTVTEKSASYVYNGTERSITGYKSMTADNELYHVKTNVAETPTDAWTAKGTNAGKYQVGIKSGDFKNTSVNFTNVAFVIVDGELEITPVTDKVTVTVVEKSDNVTYDAAEHSITGYETMTADNALYDIANVAKTPTAAWTAKGTEAGEYPVGIVSGDFKNTSKNFANVEFVIVDGALTITTDDTEVVVTVTGNTKTVVYDGTEHSVEGYTVDVNGLPITVTPKAGTEAKASGTNAGTYYMGLTADDFTAESNNYSNIRIVVTDGWLKIDPITDKVTVTITENAGTVEYDGKEHSVTGYASIVSDHALYDVANVAETPTDAWTAKGTDAGTYPVGIKSGDFRNTSGNFTNVEFVIEDGELVITRRGENPESPVTLRADDNTVMFDGDYHGYVGHIATNLAEGHSVRSVKSDFAARNVGRYEDKIDLHDAIIVDADGKDVTRNYVLTYQPGTLEITPFEGEVVVTVTGNTGLFRYDGKIHTVEGYTLEATVPFFTEDDIRFTGDATISEVRPGDYVMNLKDEEFSAANDNFTSVKFVVIDGSMRIYTVRYTVAWMFDTDQMLTGDSPNRYFTSMANYIDRSDISLVLHSGNVVADAGAQSQWDVFNNAMQPLYDDEEVDVLMIAAEKEAASGSLFLQQPVREDFKEEDLFENGKGFVRRFNIGEKSVILVGLGADAMTEEGYKWAREKFNSDKDASGILLVNNYLLEDMRKPDKIDERALDLEKNVVKACSNVRMVLSSSGGYSSHYEFYYGERKVIAINSDIEAAAKAGYFTQLTFNEDLNILSVTNLCPYTYDFVYNERQAYKECYVLNNVL